MSLGVRFLDGFVRKFLILLLRRRTARLEGMTFAAVVSVDSANQANIPLPAIEDIKGRFSGLKIRYTSDIK